MRSQTTINCGFTRSRLANLPLCVCVCVLMYALYRCVCQYLAVCVFVGFELPIRVFLFISVATEAI